MAGRLSFGDAALPFQEDVKILGVGVDQGLRCDSHVKTIGKKASQRISALRQEGETAVVQGTSTWSTQPSPGCPVPPHTGG